MKTGPQFVSATIKRLETRYGAPVDFYRPLTNGVDLSTGNVSRSYSSINIKRSLLLPFEINRIYNYDTSYLAAGNGDGKFFSFGALHDTNTSTIIVRAKELQGIVPQLDDHISWRSLKFDVKSCQPYPDIQIFVVSVIRAQGCKDFFFRSEQSLYFTGSGTP